MMMIGTLRTPALAHSRQHRVSRVGGETGVRIYLPESVYKAVLQNAISAQIRQDILYYFYYNLQYHRRLLSWRIDTTSPSSKHVPVSVPFR